MSDERKYRQRGYQDNPREPRRGPKPAEKKEYAPRGQPPLAPKTFNMPGFREVVRCARCGNELTVVAVWSPDATARAPPPAARNTCTFFEPRNTVERETKSVAPTSARKAFDDLFK
jgi:hypothetical protein